MLDKGRKPLRQEERQMIELQNQLGAADFLVEGEETQANFLEAIKHQSRKISPSKYRNGKRE